MNRQELATMIDHTLLKPNATEAMIRQTCQEALDFHTATVCVNSYWIPLVNQLLAGSSVKPIAVIGFPLGASLTEAKVAEAQLAIDAGAKEIDMVINLGALMRQTVGDGVQVKASGGIHSYQEAMAMIEAGADRLGLSGTAKVLASTSE